MLKGAGLFFFNWSLGHSASVRVRLFNTTWKALLIPKGLINPYRTGNVLIAGLENCHCLAAGLNCLTQIVFMFQKPVSRFSKQNLLPLVEAQSCLTSWNN